MRYSKYTEEFEPNHVYNFQTVPCPKCGKIATISVPAQGLFKYNQGAHIQDAFPDLSADDRERLISGVCGPCFDQLFPDEVDF